MNIILHKEWLDSMASLPAEKQIAVLRAVVAYANNGRQQPELDAMEQLAFAFIKPKLDEDLDSYNSVSEAQRQRALKRWHSEDTTECHGIPRNATAYHGMPQDYNSNGNGNNNSNHNHNDNNKDKGDNKESDGVSDETPAPESKPRKVFVKPTYEEVEAYSQEQGYWIDGHHFCDYYESNGWKVGRNAMKDWKATVRTWIKRERDNNQNNRYGTNQRGNAGCTDADILNAAINAYREVAEEQRERGKY